MPRLELERLGDDARVWIFGISPRLDGGRQEEVLRRVDTFLDGWAAHGAPIASGRAIVEDSFLLVAVDKQSETSGCSIDKMFGLLKALERDLGVAILDANRIFVRHGDGHVDAITREEFRASGDKHTHVFDTNAERLGEIRNGTWERPAEKSWHAQLLV